MFEASEIELIGTNILEILTAARIIAPTTDLIYLLLKKSLSYEMAVAIARDDLRRAELSALEIFILSKHEINFSSSY